MRGQDYSLNDAHSPFGTVAPEDSGLRAREIKCCQTPSFEKPKHDQQEPKH
jgi:hypothetical protein